MKNISLNELRNLAAAVASAEQGSKTWDKATDALHAKFSPRCLVNLIDQLEATQRDRDDYRELYHFNEGEKQTLFHQKDQLLTANLNIGKRAREAEAELKRRDDAVPVATKLVYSSVLPKFIGDTDEVESYSCFIHGNTPPRKTMEEAYADAKEICGTLYAAAPAAVLNQPDDSTAIYQMIDDGNWYDTTKSQYEDALERGELCRIVYPAPPAAVLPPEIVRNADGFGEYQGRLIGGGAIGWYNQALTDAKALGCQPAPVWIAVTERLPEECSTVLVCQEGGITFCAEFENGEFYPDEFPKLPGDGKDITHWMDMPATPAAGGSDA